MGSLKNRRKLRGLYFVAFCVISLFLAKSITNFAALQTTQISPNYKNAYLIGSYVERDGNHQPIQNAAIIDFRSLPANDEVSNLLIFSYIPADETDTVSIIFENLAINNFFTPEEDKILGFDGASRPLRYLSNVNLDDLTALRTQIDTSSEFPQECLFEAFDASFGPMHGIGWRATESCQLPSAPIRLSGYFKRSGAALRSNLVMKQGESGIKFNHRNSHVYFRKTN